MPNAECLSGAAFRQRGKPLIPSRVAESGLLPAAFFFLLSAFFLPTIPQSAIPNPQSQPLPRFTDVTAAAGIRFRHNTGAFGKKYLPETMGSGCAFFDFDGDGWPDILLLNGRDFPGHKKAASFPALYRNNRNGTFTEVTRAAGLAVEMYALGVAAGDYDNDGYEDLYITALEGDRLFHNERNGTFREVTRESGIRNANFGTSAAWLDYDRDGRLDLFVANYVKWSPEKDLYCTLDGAHKSYCTPESYPGNASRLFHNLGNGRFEDVTQRAGLADPTSKSLGVTVLDYDGDGWPDIFVANDTQPNKLYRNNHNGTFTERAVAAGIAFSEDGVARGGMGVDWADYDTSGRPHVAIANFSNQMLGLYHNEGNGLFVDEAPASTVGRASLLTLGFGLFFFDFDLDGRPDLFVANGHIEDDISQVQPRVRYAQPPHLFRNLGRRRFEEVVARVGAELARPIVARGAAYADYDRDGDLDLLITTNGGPAYLFRNDGGNRNRFLRVELKGTRSNRSAIGAVVRVKSAGAGGTEWQMQMVKSGSSYCSQSELPLAFGLGAATSAQNVEVLWPSGARQVFANVPAGKLSVVEK